MGSERYTVGVFQAGFVGWRYKVYDTEEGKYVGQNCSTDAHAQYLADEWNRRVPEVADG